MLRYTLFSFLLLATSCALPSTFDMDAKDNVAVYWGQNSNTTQDSLATYCQNSDANIFLLSFLFEFPELGLNFANSCSESFENGLLNCSQISQDIQTCQSLGKKVFLSLGGAAGSYGFSNDTEAELFAQTLWDTFAEGTDVKERPFGNSVIDGFDFNIENNNKIGYAALVSKLRSLFTVGSKDYYISAAPQCPYPDSSVGDLLQNSDVDFAFIQFYNNKCGVEEEFNWDNWVNYANNISPNSDIKLYMGLPASEHAANSGYVSNFTLLGEVISKICQSPNFGGISLWDASQAFANVKDGKHYIAQIKESLEENALTLSLENDPSLFTPIVSFYVVTGANNTSIPPRLSISQYHSHVGTSIQQEYIALNARYPIALSTS